MYPRLWQSMRNIFENACPRRFCFHLRLINLPDKLRLHLRANRFYALLHLMSVEDFCECSTSREKQFPDYLPNPNKWNFKIHYELQRNEFETLFLRLLFKWEFISRGFWTHEMMKKQTKNLRGRWLIGHYICALCFARIEFDFVEWRISGKS